MEPPVEQAPTVPPFDEAVERLANFLGNQVILRPPIWVFREDVASLKWRIWVRTPLPDENTQKARDCYEAARCRGLGVELSVLCLLELEPCCYVWSPVDEEEAGYSTIAGLKLRIPHPLLAATPVRNSLVWHYRKWYEARSPFPKYVERVPARNG